MNALSPYADLAKSAFDRIFALLALIFFLPFFALVAAAIVVVDGGPIFYRHRRVGRNGRHFDCLKFRTMYNDAELQLATILSTDPEARREWAASMKLRDDPRITPIGKWLRKSSLDELPQFLNVLRGEMSVVGPRPIVDEEVARYGDAFSLYRTVKPGITGPWQVSGRNDMGYASRVAIDASYVERRTFLGDIGIIATTILIMFTGRGAY